MPSVAELGSRAIRGFYYEKLETARSKSWTDLIANEFTSDQASETYDWLSMVPAMREWVDGKAAKGFTTNGITIENRHFEATISIRKRDIRRDKTGQLRMRMGELATRGDTHWASLLTTLIQNGNSTPCYDGAHYYSATHQEGNSPVQSNLLTSSDYPSLNVAVAIRPTVAEFANALMDILTHFFSYKDDQNEPRNEDASQFVLMVPFKLYGVALQAVTSNFINTGAGTIDNPLKAFEGQFSIKVLANNRLTWTTDCTLMRVDADAKPFIKQQETAPRPSMKAEGSDYEFDHDAWMYSIDAWRNVGYGMWWQAIRFTFDHH
jgi:phage major head subunit gpT-like protein